MSWRNGVLVGFAYLVLTVVMTWPVVARLPLAVAGDGGDPWQTMWRFEHRLDQFGQPGFLQYEFFGGGEPRLVNLSVWPWIGLQVLFGEPITYNLVWLLSFFLSGLGMYFLVRFLVKEFADVGGVSELGREWGPFLAGVIYMFLPYHVAHAMGHFGAMQVQWLPWILLVGVGWIVRPRVWKAVVLGILLVIQAWSEHHYALWLAIFGVLAVVWLYRWGDVKGQLGMLKKASKGVVVSSGSILLAAFLLVVMSYWPTIRLAWQGQSSLVLGVDQTIRFSADVFSFIVPSIWHPLWGGLVESVFTQHFTGNEFEATQYLGILPLLLLLFFHQHIPLRSKKFWLWVVGSFTVLALGPRLHLLGRVLPIPLPYALVDSWPVFSAVRAVARAGVMVSLGVSVLVGWVLATQLRRREAAGLLLAGFLLEFLFFPVPMQSTELPLVYELVRGAQGRSIVELPAATNYALASRALYASSYHGKEVFNSIALERAQEDSDFALGKQLPGIKQLLYARTTDLREGRREFFGQDLGESLPDALAWIDAAGIVVHEDSLTQWQQAAVTRFLEESGMIGEQIDDATWYARANARWRDSGDGVLALRGEGFSNVDYDAGLDATFVKIPSGGEVVFVNVSDTMKRVRLQLRVAPKNTGVGKLLVEGEPIGEVDSDQGEYRSYDFDLKPGENLVELQAQGNDGLLLLEPRFVVL